MSLAAIVANMAAICLRPHFRRRNGKREAYWTLVESYRTQSGPRQRTVARLGLMAEAPRLGGERIDVKKASTGRRRIATLSATRRLIPFEE